MTSRPLPLLNERREALLNCAFCPKLCRAACPVSDAEANESTTPWGQMGSVLSVASGNVEPSQAYAAAAFACAGCLNCTERCEQRNPVAPTLYDARAVYARLGLTPEPARRVAAGFTRRAKALKARVAELASVPGQRADAPTALLLGCDYTLRLPDEAADALAAARGLFGEFRLLGACCGLPLTLAGEVDQAAQARRALLAEMAGARRLVVVDAGCAHALQDEGATPLARIAFQALDSKRGPRNAPSFHDARYHDACQLGRGLGEYEAPRALLRLASGREPREFRRNRQDAHCSGGGGLLPLTRPETASRIATERVSEHERLGGGKLVTACARSLTQFRAAGADAVDLVTVIRFLTEG